MGAGVIYVPVTTTSGTTVSLPFYVDSTTAPTTWNSLSVQITTSSVPVTMDAGNATTSTPRVTLATDDAAIAALIAAIAGVAPATDASAVDPVLTGLFTHTSQPTPVATSVYAVRGFGDLDGASIIRHNTNLGSIVTANTSSYATTAAATCLLASGDAAIKTYLETIILTNTHTTLSSYVEIRDGTTTKLTIPVPANAGAVVNLPVPIPSTANNPWFFASATALATTLCSMVGFKSKV